MEILIIIEPLKSWFINWGSVYLLYYYPYNISLYQKNNSTTSYYNLDDSITESGIINIEKAPFYLIYTKYTDSLTTLNAKKEVLSGDKSVDTSLLKYLDTSNLVNIGPKVIFSTQLQASSGSTSPNKYIRWKNYSMSILTHRLWHGRIH